MVKSKFNPEWTKTYKWALPCEEDERSVKGDACKSSFCVANRAIHQLNKRLETAKHKENMKKWQPEKVQKKITFGGRPAMNNPKLLLTNEEQVLQAEIIQALQTVEFNHSYNSQSTQSKLFKFQFPDSKIAASYGSACIKAAYLIKYGIAEDVINELKKDIQACPFTFKFDESTTKQVKKQYDAYITYYSKSKEEVINAYAGSLFVGHCLTDSLVEHYLDFKCRYALKDHRLLHLSMDGPNVNLSFQKKLSEILEDSGATFLDPGTCSLHPVHTTLKKV